MKAFITFAILAMVVGGTANATGFQRTIYNCRGGSGEFAASVRVVHVSTSPPGGPVSSSYQAEASHSWLGGTHHTGLVTVAPVVASSGTTYQGQNFDLVVHKVEYVGRSTIPARIDVHGNFVGTDKFKFSISRRWLPCQPR